MQSVEEGIGTGNTLDDVDSEPSEEAEQDSEFDDNAEISDSEKPDLTMSKVQKRMWSELAATKIVVVHVLKTHVHWFEPFRQK